VVTYLEPPQLGPFGVYDVGERAFFVVPLEVSIDPRLLAAQASEGMREVASYIADSFLSHSLCLLAVHQYSRPVKTCVASMRDGEYDRR
jgi:hypothetical protein